MISISGIRGIVGESLLPETIVRYAGAFGEYCKRKHPQQPEVVIGRDGRVTGRFITHLVASTLVSTGVRVRALGVCPTPTVALATERTGSAGGISVTASHNPMQWNGLKFMASTGMFLNAQENSEVWKIADSGSVTHVPWDLIGTHTGDEEWIKRHIDAVLSLPYLDVTRIRKRKLRIVLDAVNAAGGMIVPHLLESMGCEVIPLNCEVSGVFTHTPEPVPENLTDLSERVRSERADLGIAVDPDVDRLVLITETGEPYGEEYTVASAVKFILEKEQRQRPDRRHTVVINLSTTRAVEDIASSYGATIVRTPVGEINVAQRMKEIASVIGGEGSGGVILPALHYGRDAIVGIGLLLQLLVDAGETLSQLKARLPQYAIAKGKITIGNGSPDTLLERMREQAVGSGVVNTDDGLRIDYPEHWIHLRKSNTEPIIRIIAEARDMERARSLVETTRSTLSTLPLD
jgi:phosphomannomutase